MSLRGDDRGVVIQVGAVLLFAFVILAITMYQVQVVPEQNEEIEFKHNEEVQDQLLEVRSAVLTTAGGGGGRSVAVTLGTNYPSRTIFLNPSPPYGKLRTVGTTNESVAIRIANARATTPETADFWNGTDRSFSTGALFYEPSYHRYDNAPTTVYENTVLANHVNDVTLLETNQSIVDNRTLMLVTLNGSLQESGVDTVSVDMEALSVSTETIRIENDSASPVTLRIPTSLPKKKWQKLLRSEFTTNDGPIERPLGYTEGGDTINWLTIRLVPDTYTLKLAKVGIGSDTEKPPTSSHYITTQDRNKSIQTGGTVSLTVKVRDRYNNPIAGEPVTIESPATPKSAETGPDGTVSFTYEAPDTSMKDNVTATIDGNRSNEERVVFSVNVTAPTIGGGGGSGGAYTLDWRNPFYDNPNASVVLSSCSDTSCTWDVGKDTDDRLNVAAVLNESIGGMTVEFGVNDTSTAFVDPDQAETNSGGESATELVAQANGTVALFASSGGDSDRIDIHVTNVTGGSGTNQPPTADFTYTPTNPDTQDAIDFTAAASSDPDGSITNYEWSFGDSATATGTNPTHSYSDNGSYSVTLTLTDNDGATDSITKMVQVANTAPTANFTWSCSSGNECAFDATGSSDADGSITSYSWDFGDGKTGAGATTTHKYSPPQSYTVTLLVTDDDGHSDSVSRTVSFSNQPPNASFSYSPTNPEVGESITFDASGSSDPDGSVVSYEWTFGDGTSATGETASHTYSSEGSYSATLTVTDGDGSTDSVTNTIQITNSPPSGAITSLTDTGYYFWGVFWVTQYDVQWSATDETGDIQQVEVQLVDSSGTVVDSQTYNYDGRGSVSEDTTLNYGGTNGAQYTVRVIVTDSAGQTATDTQSDVSDGS